MNTRDRVSVIVQCPHCQSAMRWTGRYSCRQIRPRCKTPFIVLHDESETCQVTPDSTGAVVEMVCDWLGPRILGEDED